LLESSFGCPGAWRPRRHGNLTGSGSSGGESGPQGLWAKHGMIQQRGRFRPVCSCVVKTRENSSFVELQRIFGADLCVAVLELRTH
jgi:hypothetical protein